MSLGQNRMVYNTENKAYASPEISGMTGSISSIPELMAAEKKPSSNVKRCGVCSKKTGLTGFSCRCGTIYCGLHRYPDEHSCTFDYATSEKKILEKKMVVGKLAEKMEKL